MKTTKPDAMNNLYDAVHDVAHKVAYAMLHDVVTEMHETRTRLVAVETEMAMMQENIIKLATRVENAKAELVREMEEAKQDVNDDTTARVEELEQAVEAISVWAQNLAFE